MGNSELFEKLYHPFDKLEILFEVFFDIMVVMAVAAAVSGAASALQQYLGWELLRQHRHRRCHYFVFDDFWSRCRA